MQQYKDNENASSSWHFSIRNKKNIRTYLIVLIVLVVYAFEIKVFGYAIPCIFNFVTGLKCPGCGITRLMMAAINLDFKSAFYYNPFIFVTSPVLLYFVIKNVLYDCGFIRKNLSRIDNIILYVYIVLFLLYGVVRNVV
ncbi:MAG: DUF2752 domain-containing protein [Lachnospiraceae bacterium]|nr:DUF2752 domain-containing protein [Lachnospiraceae bacterium]